jgi:hypothetical protein
MGIISQLYQVALWELFPMNVKWHLRLCQKAERSGGGGLAIAAVGRRKTREERRTRQPGESQDTTEDYELEFLVGGAARRP